MSNEPTDNLLKLPAVADLTFAPTLQQSAEQALSNSTGLTIDASEVQRIFTPCLQVLLAAARNFQNAGGAQFTIANPSEAFCESVSSLGLSAALGISGE